MAPPKARVFISYSRKDVTIAVRISAALTERGFESFLDTKQILPGEAWRERLTSLISMADAVVFLMSPDSVLPSSVCDWELNETDRLSKRLLPVVIRKSPDEVTPSRLRRLHWILMTTEEDGEAALQELDKAILRDIEWVREHTRLGELAGRWEEKSKSTSSGVDALLLRGIELAQAEAWLSQRTLEATEPTERHRSFIIASRRAEQMRDRSARRRNRVLAFGSLAAAGLMAVLTWYFFQAWRESEIARSRFLAEKSLQANAKGDSVTGSLLALEGLSDSTLPNVIARFQPYAPEAELQLDASLRDQRETLVLQGHTQAVKSASFSPDGKWILTTSEDQTARVWNAATGAETAVLEHDDSVTSAVFNRDASRLATATTLWRLPEGKEIRQLGGDVSLSADGTRLLVLARNAAPRLFDASNGRDIAIESSNAEALSATFSPSGDRIVSAGDEDGARVWDSETGRLVATLSHAEGVLRALFSPDGKRVLTTSRDGAARIWSVDPIRETVVFKSHANLIWHAAFSHDGNRATTYGEDNAVRVWDTQTGVEIRQFPESEPMDALFFSPDGSEVNWIQQGGLLKSFSVETGTTTNFGGADGARSRALSFSADGRLALTTDYSGQAARLWETSTKREIARLEGNQGAVADASFNADGTRVVTASRDGTARVWDVRPMGAPVLMIGHTKPVKAVAFSPDGRSVATASWDGTARVWDRESGREIASFKSPEITDPRLIEDQQIFGLSGKAQGVAFTPDGKRIAVAYDNYAARLWDIESKQEIPFLKGEIPHFGNSVSFSPDGKLLLIAVANGAVQIWDVASGTRVSRLIPGRMRDPPRASILHAAISPDGATVLAASNGNKAHVWSASACKEICEETAPLAGHTDAVMSVGFRPDGEQFITGSQDGTARIWSARTRKEIARLSDPGKVSVAAFSPNGARILTGGDSGARLWDAHTLREVIRLDRAGARVLGAAFSPDGQWVATGSSDGIARVYRVFATTEDLFETAQSRLPRCLTPEQRDASFLTPRSLPWCRQRQLLPFGLADYTARANRMISSGDAKSALAEADIAVVSKDESKASEWSRGAAYLVRGLASHLLGDANAAERDFSRALQSGQDVAAPLLQALERPQSDPKSVQANRYDSAVDWAMRDQKHLKTRARAFFERGKAHLRESNLPAAFSDLEQAERLGIDAASFLTDAGTEQARSDRGLAISALTEAVRLAGLGPAEPKVKAVALIERAQVLRLEERYAEAIADLKEVEPLGHPLGHGDAGDELFLAMHGLAAQKLKQGAFGEALIIAVAAYLDARPLLGGGRDFRVARVRLRTVTEPLAALYAQQSGAEAAPATECDRLASHPFDPLRVAEGVIFENIDTAAAIAACDKAISLDGNSGRLRTERARTHLRVASDAKAAGDEQKFAQHRDDAVADLKVAMTLGYPFAFHVMGNAYAEGAALATSEDNEDKAAELYLEAFNRIIAGCAAPVVKMLPRTAPANDAKTADRVASELLRWAAALGDPRAHEAMADLVITDMGRETWSVPLKTAALEHLKIAQRLFTESGRIADANRASAAAEAVALDVLDADVTAALARAAGWSKAKFTDTPPWL